MSARCARLCRDTARRAGLTAPPTTPPRCHLLATTAWKCPGDRRRGWSISSDLVRTIWYRAGHRRLRDVLKPGTKRFVIRGAEVRREREHVRPAKTVGPDRLREEGGVRRQAAEDLRDLTIEGSRTGSATPCTFPSCGGPSLPSIARRGRLPAWYPYVA